MGENIVVVRVGFGWWGGAVVTVEAFHSGNKCSVPLCFRKECCLLAAVYAANLPDFTVFFYRITTILTASVVYWSEFLATDTEVPGSIPGATTFSE